MSMRLVQVEDQLSLKDGIRINNTNQSLAEFKVECIPATSFMGRVFGALTPGSTWCLRSTTTILLNFFNKHTPFTCHTTGYSLFDRQVIYAELSKNKAYSTITYFQYSMPVWIQNFSTPIIISTLNQALLSYFNTLNNTYKIDDKGKSSEHNNSIFWENPVWEQLTHLVECHFYGIGTPKDLNNAIKTLRYLSELASQNIPRSNPQPTLDKFSSDAIPNLLQALIDAEKNHEKKAAYKALKKLPPKDALYQFAKSYDAPTPTTPDSEKYKKLPLNELITKLISHKKTNASQYQTDPVPIFLNENWDSTNKPNTFIFSTLFHDLKHEPCNFTPAMGTTLVTSLTDPTNIFEPDFNAVYQELTGNNKQHTQLLWTLHCKRTPQSHEWPDNLERVERYLMLLKNSIKTNNDPNIQVYWDYLAQKWKHQKYSHLTDLCLHLHASSEISQTEKLQFYELTERYFGPHCLYSLQPSLWGWHQIKPHPAFAKLPNNLKLLLHAHAFDFENLDTEDKIKALKLYIEKAPKDLTYLYWKELIKTDPDNKTFHMENAIKYLPPEHYQSLQRNLTPSNTLIETPIKTGKTEV